MSRSINAVTFSSARTEWRVLPRHRSTYSANWQGPTEHLVQSSERIWSDRVLVMTPCRGLSLSR